VNNTNSAARKNKTAFSAFAIACALTGLAALTPATATAQVWGGGDFGVAPLFKINQSRPKLVLLIHGITPKPEEDQAVGIGSAKHARHYWGFEFIKGLQGRMDENAMRVITPKKNGTLQLQTNMIEDWFPRQGVNNPDDLAPICYPISWNKQLPPGIEWNQTLIKDHIRLMTKNSESIMVMVNTRDGSKHLMPQVGETIDEVFNSYRAAFGHLDEKVQPQIYIVGHSFGGVIARTLLANPAGADLFGNKLTATQRTRADYLRQRVVLVKTLSTPHEGSLVGDLAGDAANWMDTVGKAVLEQAVSAYSFIPWKMHSESWVKGTTKNMLETAMNAISGRRDCLEDVRRMSEYNAGILKENTARRSANGEIIPIFSAAGRNPSGTFYDSSRSVGLFGGTWNPVTNLDIATGYNRFAKEAMALTIIETVMRQEGYGVAPRAPWGKTTFAEGDRMRSPYTFFGTTLPRKFSDPLVLDTTDLSLVIGYFLLGAPYTAGPDGEWDNDGFVGWNSSHALNQKGTNWYRVYDQKKYGSLLPWDQDHHGSMMFNVGTAQWIHNELLRTAGPYNFFPGSRRSTWTMLDGPVTPRHGIKLDFIELKDIAGDLDYSGAEFTLKATIGTSQNVMHGPDNTNTWKNIPSFAIDNYQSTVIPIKIDVIERDQPYDPDDQCVVTPEDGQTALYLYYDVRTNRISGDLNGMGGEVLTSRGNTAASNRVQLKFKVTRFQ
jgi:hypothetical protein